MKQETLKKAKELENNIKEIKEALKMPQNASHYAMLEHYGPDARRYHLPKELNPKIKTLLIEESLRLESELENLTDENVNNQNGSEPTYNQGNITQEIHEDQPSRNPARRRTLVNGTIMIYCWMIFCIVCWLLGYAEWFQAVGYILLSAFMIYFINKELQLLKSKESKED